MIAPRPKSRGDPHPGANTHLWRPPLNGLNASGTYPSPNFFLQNRIASSLGRKSMPHWLQQNIHVPVSIILRNSPRVYLNLFQCLFGQSSRIEIISSLIISYPPLSFL